eukprot:Seg128.2 transcript_id=Seg128.2/GoldUCD/mRNA.D3Y31 product="hypothetical protein" protein_id=Seg128.2/GoldUCD/D3Y31
MKKLQAAKTKESDKDIILDLETKIRRFQTELGIEKRLKNEAKQDHEDIQAELDELLSENEGLRNKLRQSKQDNERLQDERQDLIEEYKEIMENNFGEALEARILESEEIVSKNFDKERAELVQEIEQYRQYGEQLEEENNEFKVRMQRKVEELKEVRSALSKSESYRQQDIDRLLQEKESLKTELKKKKKNLTSLQETNQELLETISQTERELRKFQKRKSNDQESLAVKDEKFELEKKLEEKELEIANLNTKIKDLQASLRCKSDCEQDISGMRMKFEADLHKMEANIFERESKVAQLKRQNSDLIHELQMQENYHYEEKRAIQDQLTQKMQRLQEISEEERHVLAEKVDQLMGQKAALQDSCKQLEAIVKRKEDAALERQASEARNEQVEEENAKLAAKLQGLYEQLDEINEQNAALKDSYTYLQVEVQEKEEAALQHLTCEARNKQYQDENAEQAAKLQELTEQLDEINKHNAALQDSCNRLEDIARKNEEGALQHQGCKAKIKQFENESAEQAANLQGLTVKLDVISKQNAALKSNCKHFEDMALENEEAALQYQACKAKMKQSEDENADQAAKLQELTAKLDEVTKQNAVLNSSCKDFKYISGQNEEAALEHQACEAKIRQFESEKAELEARCQELIENIDEINKQNAALQDRSSRFDILTAQNEEDAAKILASEAELTELKEKNTELKSQLLKDDTMIEELKQSRSNVEVLKRQASELEADLQAKDSAIAEIQGQEYTFTELKEENEILQSEITDLKANLRETESKVTANDDAFNVQLQDLKDLVDQMSAQEKELTAKNTALKNEIKELRYSLKAAENYTETQQEKFEKEVLELEQKVVFMKAEENQLRRCVAELELHLSEERKQTTEVPKQDLQNEGEQLATLEAKINDLESDNQELQNMTQSLKKQLKEQEETFEANRNSLINKLQEAEKKWQQSIKEQLVLEAQFNESRAAQNDLDQRVAECEAVIAEKEAVSQESAASIKETEQLLAKSEQDRLQYEQDSAYLRAVMDMWTEEFNALKAENNKFRKKLGKRDGDSKSSQNIADDCEELQEEIKELQESLTNMKTRERKIQDHNYEMKKKVDAGDKLQKELEDQIKELHNELSKVKQNLEDAEIEIKTQQDERNVFKMRNDNWEELKNIAEQQRTEVKAKDEIINEMEEENRTFRADIRKLQFTARELEDKIEGLESEKEEYQEMKEFYQEQFEKRKDNQELLECTENDLKQAYEDMQVLSTQKKQLAIKCQQLEEQFKNSGCEQQKDESVRANPANDEKEQEGQNGGYESDFEEEDEKSASQNGGKDDNSWDRESNASDVGEIEDLNDDNNNNNNKVDDNKNKGNNDNAPADESKNNIESDKMENEHHNKDDDDDDLSVNFSDDNDGVLNTIPSETGIHSAAAEDQSSARKTKSILSKTESKISSPKKEAERKVTFNDDEEVCFLYKDDHVEEFSDDDDFYNTGYVPSFSGRPTGPQLGNVKEEDTDVTSSENKRSLGASDIFEKEDDMLSSFITTQKKKQKDSIQVSKQRKMKIELGLADSIDDILDEIEASEGSQDEAAGAKDGQKEATVKGSGAEPAKTDASNNVKDGAAENNVSNEIQRKQNSEKKYGKDVNGESEENVTEDITVEEINLDDADYFEHIEPLELDAENEPSCAEATAESASGENDAENVTEDITVEEINLDDADYFEHIEPLELDAENEPSCAEATPLELDAENEPSCAESTAESASGENDAENVTEDITVEEINLDDADYFEHIEPLEFDADNEPSCADAAAESASSVHEADVTEAAERANDLEKEAHLDNEDLQNTDRDSSITGIELRTGGMPFSPSLPPLHGRGLPPIAGRAGALPPLRAGSLPPLIAQAEVSPLGAQAGVLRPRRRKNKKP